MATGLSSLRREFSEPLQILMAIVALVLLIACANIANLLLARSTVRARELAVRQALGARRTRLVRQLLTESLFLAFAGGALGVGLAVVANRMLLRMVSGGLEPVPLNLGLDLRLLAFTFGVTVLTAAVFGTIPAIRATRIHLTDALKDGRGPSSGGPKTLWEKLWWSLRSLFRWFSWLAREFFSAASSISTTSTRASIAKTYYACRSTLTPPVTNLNGSTKSLRKSSRA